MFVLERLKCSITWWAGESSLQSMRSAALKFLLLLLLLFILLFFIFFNLLIFLRSRGLKTRFKQSKAATRRGMALR